jgi:lysyl-tRNA synthetase class II
MISVPAWVGVEGGPMTTRTGELSLCVAEFSVLAEATRWTPGRRGELCDASSRRPEPVLLISLAGSG